LETPGIVALGGCVGASHQPQRGDGHLATQRPFHLLVDRALQLDGAQRLAAVKGGFAHGVLHRAERSYRGAHIGVIGQEDGDGPLDFHALMIPHLAHYFTVGVCGTDHIPYRLWSLFGNRLDLLGGGKGDAGRSPLSLATRSH
jgi:hypothetical protein